MLSWLKQFLAKFAFLRKYVSWACSNEALWKGYRGERIAARYLRRQAYKIVERNWRHGRCEIDIIARDRDCLVFVEVRSRQKTQLYSAYDSVDHRKKQNLRCGIYAYLREHRVHAFRMDIVAIDWIEGTRDYELHHYENVSIR